MAILKVAQLGHPILRKVARDLTPDEIRSTEVRQLVQDMLETMTEYGGVGLAAPQVHHSVRIALVEIESDNPRYQIGEDDAVPVTVLFNARVTVLDDAPFGFWEGCLSVHGLRGYVERPSKVRVDYLDHDAKPQVIEAEGFPAVVLQHELDHLDGVLYVDKLVDSKQFAFVDEFARYHAE